MKLVFLLVLCVVGVKSDCTCYQTTNSTGKSAQISNAYSTDDFSACYSKPCSYVAYSGDDSYGWTNLMFTWDQTSNSGGLFQIFDGVTDSGSPLIQISEGENVQTGDVKNLIKSSSPRITIKYIQSGTGSNSYYGVIKASPGLQPSTVAVTTTPVPTTRAYNNSVIPNDPFSITHDILVVVNTKSNGGTAALNSLNTLARTFVNLLSTTTDINSASGSRLALATFTPYSPFYSVQGGIWELDQTSFNASLPLNGFTIEGQFDNGLIALANLAFQVNQNDTTDSRPNVQRSIILLSAGWPTSGADLNETVVKPEFDKRGVNLLVVGYNLTDVEQSKVLRTSQWYNAINLVSSDLSDVASFVNPYYFNDGSKTNFWCPKTDIQVSSDKSYSYFSEPNNYNGPDGLKDNTTNWSTFSDYHGENSRYCNFANNQYVYNNPTNANVKVSVYYELEAGKDTLNFYDASNNLIASFTGYDIAEGSFFTSTSTLTAKFSSDNQSVFRGFFVKITPQN